MSRECPQRRNHVFDRRMVVHAVPGGPADDAVLVDHEHGAPGETTLTEHTKRTRDLALRMEVTQHLHPHAESLGPGPLGWARIGADDEHLGVEPVDRRTLTIVGL